MAMKVVLNDLSLLCPISERGLARELMSELISVISTAQMFGSEKILRTQENLYNLILSPGYPIASWLNDPQVEREERQFLTSKLDIRTPLLLDITDEEILEKESLTDFKFQGNLSYALGIAYLLNALVVSFHSDPVWNSATLEIDITQLEDQEKLGRAATEMTLETSIQTLVHASQRKHVLKHKEIIQSHFRAEPWHPDDPLLPCYIPANGQNLISEWLNSLNDRQAKEFIQTRLDQAKQGNLGDYKSVGEGVWELRITYGPAYRIYFGQVTPSQQLLLYGGDKSTQARDIIRAKQHWQDYKRLQKTIKDRDL
jgi:putative addiction module killer protein